MTPRSKNASWAAKRRGPMRKFSEIPALRSMPSPVASPLACPRAQPVHAKGLESWISGVLDPSLLGSGSVVAVAPSGVYGEFRLVEGAERGSRQPSSCYCLLSIVEPGTANFSSEGFQGAREEKSSQPVATSTVNQCGTMRRRAPDTASRTVRPQRWSIQRCQQYGCALLCAETTVFS